MELAPSNLSEEPSGIKLILKVLSICRTGQRRTVQRQLKSVAYRQKLQITNPNRE
jgi:hypothetical protein